MILGGAVSNCRIAVSDKARLLKFGTNSLTCGRMSFFRFPS